MPDLEDTFRGYVPARDAQLLALEEEARQEGIPIAGPLVGELLGILVQATGARRVLELGTATGYSTLYLARACEAAGGRVTTLERDPSLARRARTHFERAGLAGRIEVRTGDAAASLSAMTEPFDLVFLDVDKEQYADLLPHCVRLLRVGGLLVADNVGFLAAREFNRRVCAHDQLRAVHLLAFLPSHSPERDGLCLAVRTHGRPAPRG